MSDVDTSKYAYGDLDRRGKFFGLHLPQFVIGWLVLFSLIPMLHAGSVATVVWLVLLDIVLGLRRVRPGAGPRPVGVGAGAGRPGVSNADGRERATRWTPRRPRERDQPDPQRRGRHAALDPPR